MREKVHFLRLLTIHKDRTRGSGLKILRSLFQEDGGTRLLNCFTGLDQDRYPGETVNINCA